MRFPFSAKFTNKDRMDITDPDWKEDVFRQRSYKWIGVGFIVFVLVVAVLQVVAAELDCSILDLFHKAWHHILPHVESNGKDALPKS